MVVRLGWVNPKTLVAFGARDVLPRCLHRYLALDALELKVLFILHALLLVPPRVSLWVCAQVLRY